MTLGVFGNMDEEADYSGGKFLTAYVAGIVHGACIEASQLRFRSSKRVIDTLQEYLKRRSGGRFFTQKLHLFFAKLIA